MKKLIYLFLAVTMTAFFSVVPTMTKKMKTQEIYRL